MTNTYYQLTPLLLVAVFAALAGCYVGSSSYNGSIGFSGNMTEHDGDFVMEGEVVDGGVRSVNATDLRIYLYHENGSRIKTVRVGQFQRQKPVSIRCDTIPYYIILDAPAFWNTPKVGVDYYRPARSGDYYVPEPVSNRYELPVNLPDQGGDDHGPGTGSGANRPRSTFKK